MLEDEIHELENARYRAMVSNDLATLEQVLSEDLIYTHSSARIDSKHSYIESLRSGKVRYVSAERQQESFRDYGNVAVINGRMKAHAVVDGSEKTLNNVFTCVWVKNPQGWQMSSWASTPIPPT
jgi:ketosteroid isomerase-like protein